MIDPANEKRAALQVPTVQTVKTGQFPHQAHRPDCDCPDGEPAAVRNYAGHVVAPPRCSVCQRSYLLDITLMPTYEPKKKETRGRRI